MASTAVEVVVALTAKDAASAVLSNVASKFQGLGTAAKVVTAGVAAVATAVVGTVTTLAALGAKAAATAGEVSKLKRETGLTAEEASKLKFAGDRLGLGVDELSAAFKKFDGNLITNKDRFKELGIQIDTNKQGNINFLPTLGNVADKFAGMPPGVEKSALAVELFGKKGLEMIPFLDKGKAGLKELGEKADALGLVFDENTLGAAKRFRESQKDIAESFEGIKNKIGMAVLPILGDLSIFLMGMVNAVFPTVMKGIDTLRETFGTVAGVVKDMVKAWQGDMAGGGDVLGKLIGPKAAADFMAIVSNVSLTFNHFWETTIKPALEYIWQNAPIIWEVLRQAIETAWLAAKPHLEKLVEQIKALKDRFDALPDPVKKWAMETTVAVAAIKVLGVDDMIMGWVNAIGNFASGIGATIVAIRTFGIVVVAAGLIFAAFALAIIGATVFIITHLDELDDAWTMLSLLFKLEFAKVVDFLQNAWQGFVGFIVGKINDLIDKVNDFIGVLNMMPGVSIPLISKIQIDLPNAHHVDDVLNEIARNRQSTITITTVYHTVAGNATPQAAGGDYMVGPSYGGPRLFLAGEAGDERATFTPKGQSGPAGGGSGTVINIYADVVDAQALDRFADKIGARWIQARRMQGLA